jgi:hypothetical protein
VLDGGRGGAIPSWVSPSFDGQTLRAADVMQLIHHRPAPLGQNCAPAESQTLHRRPLELPVYCREAPSHPLVLFWTRQRCTHAFPPRIILFLPPTATKSALCPPSTPQLDACSRPVKSGSASSSRQPHQQRLLLCMCSAGVAERLGPFRRLIPYDVGPATPCCRCSVILSVGPASPLPRLWFCAQRGGRQDTMQE